VSFGFSPLLSRVPAQEVSVELPQLDFVGDKMSEMEDVIASRLEAGGRILAEAVVEHVLLCFHSHDPEVSLEPMVQGPTKEVQEAGQVSVREMVKLVAEQFERMP
jgi:hypothetical protein